MSTQSNPKLMSKRVKAKHSHFSHFHTIHDDELSVRHGRSSQMALTPPPPHGQLMTLTLALSPISTLFMDLVLKPREKSIAIYFPSHIYPLQSLTISFSPWAANYRETPTSSWAVICGAAGPHPLDLLPLSPSETASRLSYQFLYSFFFLPLVNVTSFLSPAFFSLSLFPLNLSFFSPSSFSCNDLHTASTIRTEGEKKKKKLILNNKINFLSAANWLIIQGERLTAVGLQKKIRRNTHHTGFVCIKSLVWPHSCLTHTQLSIHGPALLQNQFKGTRCRK